MESAMKHEYAAEIGEYNDSVSAYYEEEEKKEAVLTRYSRCNQLYNQFQSQHSANKSTFGVICDNFCVLKSFVRWIPENSVQQPLYRCF